MLCYNLQVRGVQNYKKFNSKKDKTISLTVFSIL
jgi:hypothetical protein